MAQRVKETGKHQTLARTAPMIVAALGWLCVACNGLPGSESRGRMVASTDAAAFGGPDSSSSSAETSRPRIPATAITVGAVQACVLLADGTVRCWGIAYGGSLGDGTTMGSKVPVAVSNISGVLAIGSGQSDCALLSDGTVACWGENGGGQLGNGTTTDANLPVRVSGLSGVRAIAVGGMLGGIEGHACALLSDGTVECWGVNDSGQLGNGTMTDSDVPVPVSSLSNVSAIAAGGYHTCAVLADGTVECWGRNGDGQLGNGTMTDSDVPVPVSGLSAASAIAAGGGHTCAVLSGGTVECWGWNGEGQLGNGTTTDSDAPVAISSLSGVSAIAAGGAHTCALISGGTVECWGWNGDGQLGNGTATDSAVPVAVSGLFGVSAIATGEWNTCAVLSDGTAQWWGYNPAVGEVSADDRFGDPAFCDGGPCSTTPLPVTW